MKSLYYIDVLPLTEVIINIVKKVDAKHFSIHLEEFLNPRIHCGEIRISKLP